MSIVHGSREIKCFLCDGIPNSRHGDFVTDAIVVECGSCGGYRITEECVDELERPRSRIPKHQLAGAVRESSRRKRVDLTTSSVQSLLSLAPSDRDIAGKARRLLSALARSKPIPGHFVSRGDFSNADAYSRDGKEFDFIWRYLVDQGWTQTTDGSKDFSKLKISPDGWEELATRSHVVAESAFVAMWFDPQMGEAWSTAIRAAIEDDCHWRAERVDEVEHNGDVVDRILGGIRGSRFVVADFTGHREGVYFEAGFALGLGIPVIWTCRNDHMENAHFDINHFSHIVWTTPAELRLKLANRIRATIGEGNFEPQF